MITVRCRDKNIYIPKEKLLIESPFINYQLEDNEIFLDLSSKRLNEFLNSFHNEIDYSRITTLNLKSMFRYEEIIDCLKELTFADIKKYSVELEYLQIKRRCTSPIPDITTYLIFLSKCEKSFIDDVIKNKGVPTFCLYYYGDIDSPDIKCYSCHVTYISGEKLNHGKMYDKFFKYFEL